MILEPREIVKMPKIYIEAHVMEKKIFSKKLDLKDSASKASFSH